jgi:hypothetical protein
MNPKEVAGLQSLAMAHGTSLTINPKTGLPEAFVLAPLIGLGMKAAGLNALQAGLATGLLGWAITGDLGQGLMSGLGGFGGANLGGALGKFGAQSAAQNLAPQVATVGGGAAASAAPSALSSTATPLLSQSGTMVPNSALLGGTSLATPATLSVPSTGIESIGAGFSKALSDPLAFAKAYPTETLTAAALPFAGALTPPRYEFPKPAEEYKGNYEGPYTPTVRTPRFPTEEEREQNLGGREFQYFDTVHPFPGYQKGFAGGGGVFEEPDPDSDPGETAVNQIKYGITGYASGGTAEVNYGISPVASVGGPTSYSVPSVAFQQQLDAREKQIQELMQGPKNNVNPAASMGIFGQMFNRVRPPGLSRAEAEARLGPAPVWNPASMQGANQTPIAAQGPRATYQGTGITSLPATQQPPMQPDALGDYTAAVQQAIGLPRLAKGGYLDGHGDGMSDSILATIEGKQPARLADGEFVVSADVVSGIGNGSTKAGAKRLYAMMDRVREARTGTTEQGKQINPNEYLPA